MQNKIFKSVLFIGMMAALMSFDLPKGWFKAGDKPGSYDMGIDKSMAIAGKSAVTIKSIDKKIDGFGTLMQNCMPDKYLGKRIKMSGLFKSQDVSEWAGFWLRIDEKGSTESLGFDNMHDGKKDRSIKGTTEWTKHEIILDVPANASNIAFGALLSGTGQIWFADLHFDIVDNTVPTTGMDAGKWTPNKEPVNLDFQK